MAGVSMIRAGELENGGQVHLLSWAETLRSCMHVLGVVLKIINQSC